MTKSNQTPGPASVLNCLYEAHFATGMERLTGREIVKRVGWTDFQADEVHHSGWCTLQHEVTPTEGAWEDPWLDYGLSDDEPPF